MGRRWLGIGGPIASVSIALGTLLGAGAYTLHYGEATSYMSNDPAVCTNCHIMRPYYDAWQKAGHHAAATCNDCHLPVGFPDKLLVKAENGYRHSKGFTLQDFHEPIRIRPGGREVVNGNCVRCHEELTNDIRCAETEALPCIRCHASAGHGPVK